MRFIAKQAQSLYHIDTFGKLQKQTLQIVQWYVQDEVHQITVFEWAGRTAKEKCEAVASALESLNHGGE